MQGDVRVLQWLAAACKAQLARLPTTLEQDEELYRTCQLGQEAQVEVPGRDAAAHEPHAPRVEAAPAGEDASAAAAGCKNAAAGTADGGGAGEGVGGARGVPAPGSTLSDGLTPARVALEWRLAYKRTLARGAALAEAGTACLQRRLRAVQQAADAQ